MFIVNQDRNEIINTDNVVRIFVENEVRIVAETSGGDNIMLGMYIKRENKAQGVFEEIIKSMFVPNLVAVNTIVTDDYAEKFKNLRIGPWGIAVGPGEDIRPYSREVFYMPEE